MARDDGVTRPSIDTIEAAADRLNGHARRTPLLNSPFLDEIAGRPVWLKAESLQKTGSFKYRGARAALTALSDEDRARGVVAVSSGNHAQGVALAAKELGVSATIVMPADAPALKLANTRAFGAEVITYDRASVDRDQLVEEVAAERGLSLVRPFNDPMVISGQGTTGLEIAEQASEAGIKADHLDVLVCCGGGGLSSGIALALEDRAPGWRVRTVEPNGFDDVARSIATGAIQSNNQTTGSIQDAILTQAPGNLTFEVLNRLAGPGLAISDGDALRAMALAYQRLKIVLEPGGAAALAAALFQPDAIDGDAVVVLGSGGNVDPPIFARALATLND